MSLFELGRIARPHGLRGEVRVALHNPNSRTLTEVGSVVLRSKDGIETTRRVLEARPTNKAVLLRMEGIADRGQAEAIRGQSVCVRRSEMPAPEEGEYYLLDLVGAEVLGPGGAVGEVVEVRVHPSVDSIVVRAPDGTLLEQPLVEPWIESVDAQSKRVVLASLDGLI